MPRARSPAANFAKLLDGAATPIYLVDDERRIIYCNAACTTWLGVPADDLIGTQCAYHSSPEGTPASVAAAGICPPPEVFAGKRLRATIAAPCGRRTRHVEFLAFYDESGEVALVLAVVDVEDTNEQAANIGDNADEALHELVRRFRQLQSSHYRIDRLIGQSPQIVRAREQVALTIDTAASVLILGPTGSGKDHLARTIHDRGGQPLGPLVPLACATLGAELLISTLAAAVKSHPAQKSSKTPSGTLLLGDVDELPAAVHLDFSRLLAREGTSLRLIATASQPLESLVAKVAFPADLACALGTIEIALPPLARRLEDLPPLAQLFLEDANARGEKQVSTFTPEALDLLAAHSWPNNLDELAAVVAEAHARTSGTQITPRDLPDRLHRSQEATARAKRADESIDLEEFLARVERELIERALFRAKGNKTRAAKLLGMTRPRLYRRLVQLKMAE